MCDHRYDGDGLKCCRDHNDRGHVYIAESSAPDAKRDADGEVDR